MQTILTAAQMEIQDCVGFLHSSHDAFADTPKQTQEPREEDLML